MASSEGQRRTGSKSFPTTQVYYRRDPSNGPVGAVAAAGPTPGETSSCCKNCTKPVEKFDKCVLIREDPIGQPGAFGCVIKAVLNVDNPKIAGTVALKMFHAPVGKNRYSVFQEMFNLQHRNLIKFLGIIDTDPTDCPQLIFKCASAGNLLDYVKRDLSTPLDAEGELYNLALDVVNGMEYLHQMDFIHGCLSARNILLHEFGRSGQIHAQISDYGMNRVTAGNGVNYFNYMTGKSMPIRWLAKECIPVDRNPGEIIKASDAWSFAVVLWEMLTRGDTPYGSYGTVSNLEVKKHILNGSSPLAFQRPDKCPEFLLRIMKSLFVVDPEQRPTFGVLKKRFEDEIESESEIPAPSSTRFRGSSSNSRNNYRNNNSSSERSNRGSRGARGGEGRPRGRRGRGHQSGTISPTGGYFNNSGEYVRPPNQIDFDTFNAFYMQRAKDNAENQPRTQNNVDDHRQAASTADREDRESISHQGRESVRGNRGSRGNRGRSHVPRRGQNRADVTRSQYSNNHDASQNQNNLRPTPGHRGGRGRSRSPQPRTADDAAPPPTYKNSQDIAPPPYSEIDTTTSRRNKPVGRKEDNISAKKETELDSLHAQFLKLEEQMKLIEQNHEKKKREAEEMEKKRAEKLVEKREHAEEVRKQLALEAKWKLAADTLRQNRQKQQDAELKEDERRQKQMQKEKERQEMQRQNAVLELEYNEFQKEEGEVLANKAIEINKSLKTSQEERQGPEVKGSYYQFDLSKLNELLVAAQREKVKAKEAQEEEEALRQEQELDAQKKADEVQKQKEAKEKEDEEARRYQQALEDEEIARLTALRREKNIRVLEENRRKQAEFKDELEARRLQDELDRKIAQEERDAEHARQLHEQELLEEEQERERERQRAIEANERRKQAELEERRRQHALFQEQLRNNMAQYGQTERPGPLTRTTITRAQAYGQDRNPVRIQDRPQPMNIDPIPIPPNRANTNNVRAQPQPPPPKAKEGCSIM